LKGGNLFGELIVLRSVLLEETLVARGSRASCPKGSVVYGTRRSRMRVSTAFPWQVLIAYRDHEP
jgi:hypothetical protein